ncbi:MAG: acetate--CoA ligase family protein [Pseudomonadota bacterium]
MPRGNASLDNAVFAPNSIGLIGLSSNPNTPAGRPLGYLRQNNCMARIVVVNPRHDQVQGERTYASLSECSAPPEHAYVLVGHNRVEQAVKNCAEAGVHVCTVLADGYAEAGPEGRAAQDRLVAIARDAGMRLLGPNSMGVADLHSGCLLTVNAIYKEPALPGPVSLISQSGSMMGGLISRAAALGLGFSRVAAVGNEADLGVAELGSIMLDDPHCKVLALFLETIRDAQGLAAMAAKSQLLRKPVVAYKLGRSDVGAKMAVAHTGALLSDDAVIGQFLQDIGIARVTTLDGLIEAPMLFAGREPFAALPRVGTITTTGGGGATVTDRLALEGVALATPSPDTMAAVRATGLDVVDGPMVDLTMAGAGADFVKPTVEAMARQPDVDIVLSITGSSGRSNPAGTIPPLAEADLSGKPLAAFVTPDAVPTLQGLISAGVPAFRTPESAADAIGALARWRAPRIDQIAWRDARGGTRVLDESASLKLLAEIGIPTVPAVEWKLDPTPNLPFDFPLVAKVLSDAVPHKTEAGGVVLDIQDQDALIAAGHRIKTSVEAYHPGLTVDRLLVAPMIRPLQEVLIGYRLDPSVGPVVTLAPGGILVGIYDDKAVRLAPVSEAVAMEMIAEVKGLAPLRGHRGLPEGDLKALAMAIAKLSTLALHHITVLEAEANPVMVLTDGIMAADALVTLATEIAEEDT